MKVTKTVSVELDVEDIESAIKYWLEHEKGKILKGEVDFIVRGHNNPDDWNSSEALSYELDGAELEIESDDKTQDV